MGYFDDIVPPNTAASYVAGPPGVPRITVRPKGIEPPPGPGNEQISADASDETDDTALARRGGFFDDIVPPESGSASLFAVDASTETNNSPPAGRGLFDDIVPPAIASASVGGQFAAPLPDGRNFRVAREGISPPAGFADRLAAMWKNPPNDRLSLIGLVKSTYEGVKLPGEVVSGETPILGPDGRTSEEVISRTKDLAQVYQLRGAPGGFFGRPIKGRVANSVSKPRGAPSDEAAAAPRGTIAPTAPPAPPRQILASEQGVPNPRAGPQSPARPPDKAAAQSDRMNSEARESGPFDSNARRADAMAPRRGKAEATPAETRAPPTGKFYSVAFEMKLKLSSLRRSRQRHFQEANEALLRAMESDPEFARAMEKLRINIKRTPTGLAPRTPPSGWTWHHADERGVLQLVPRSQHKQGTIFQRVLHPKGGGGYSKWGK